MPSLANLQKRILDLLFPPRCVGCNKRDLWLCSTCLAKVPLIEPPFCRICGHPTAGTQVCVRCYARPPQIESIRAPYFFEGALREAIHRFKYNRSRHLSEPLAAILANYVAANNIIVDAIVPVPLHKTRLTERGYNQSALLAQDLGRISQLPVILDMLERIRATQAQMSLPASKRADNVRGAFACKRGVFRGKSLLLIDDVCTTGATLEACAIALKAAGAQRVYGLCLARARLDRYSPHQRP